MNDWCDCCGPGVSCTGDLIDDDETGEPDVDDETDEASSGSSQLETQRSARQADAAAGAAQEESGDGSRFANREQGATAMGMREDLDAEDPSMGVKEPTPAPDPSMKPEPPPSPPEHSRSMRLADFSASYIGDRPKLEMTRNFDSEKLQWIENWIASWPARAKDVYPDNTETLKNALADSRRLLRKYVAAEDENEKLKAEVKMLRDTEKTQVNHVVSIIGGTVEGRPTLTINYLQRLRELVDKEVENDRVREALENVVRPPPVPLDDHGVSKDTWTGVPTRVLNAASAALIRLSKTTGPVGSAICLEEGCGEWVRTVGGGYCLRHHLAPKQIVRDHQ